MLGHGERWFRPHPTDALAVERRKEHVTLQVIGAGFARTGTLSLQQALNDLGFGPTYHMNDVFQNPSHAQKWLDYADAGTADWEGLFANYQSVVDFPAACTWKELYDEYPDAKVVLSVRDPTAWWRSTSEVIYPTRTMFPTWLKLAVPFTQRWLHMVDRLVWSGLFEGRFEDKAHAIKVFEDHVEAVRAHCDPERLLVFDVSQGWQPLCDFLDVPMPLGPFPRLNDSASLQRRFAGIRWGTRLAPLFILLAAGATALRRR